MGDVLWRNARPVVLHDEGACPGANPNGRTGRRVDERVLDQNARDLNDSLLVAQRQRAVGRLELDRMPTGARERRELVHDGLTDLNQVDRLTPDRHALAVEVAREPEQIRGYGPIKRRNAAAAKSRETALLEAYRADVAAPRAAAE